MPADPTEAAERAALEAYRGMWLAFDQAGRSATGVVPEAALETYATGNALQRLLDGLQSYRDNGLIIDGALTLNPEVTRLEPSIAPTSAEVEDCGDSTDWRLIRSDGEPYEDEPGGFRQIFAELELGDDGAWRVVDFAVLEVGTC